MSKKPNPNILTESRSTQFIETRIRRNKKIAATRSESISELAELDLWDQVVRVRQGLPSVCVVEMSDALAMSRTTLINDLQLARSTIEGRIKKKTHLTTMEGQRVLRAVKVLAKAEAVFEDRTKASAWIKREIRSLGGVTPISLLVTSPGFELVMHKLGQIEYGVVA